MENVNPRDIFSSRPFQNMAKKYAEYGWIPLPIPERKKSSPPTGYTGRKAKEVTKKLIVQWLTDPKFAKSNIAVRVTTVMVDGELWEVFGLDVDDYVDGVGDDGKPIVKDGWRELKLLESQYGELPDTWISTSRTDGKSGIRFFLVPPGLHWNGKASKGRSCIETIQAGHRYAVMAPSIHPNGNPYISYPPGKIPDGTPALTKDQFILQLNDRIAELELIRDTGLDAAGEEVMWVDHEDDPYLLELCAKLERVRVSDPANYGEIPRAELLPKLPDAWVDYLTNNRKSFEDFPMDLLSSPGEIEKWADKFFRRTTSEEKGLGFKAWFHPCRQMDKQIKEWREKVHVEEASHPNILAAHWNIIQMGYEGHAGWKRGLREINREFLETVGSRGKRGLDEAQRELWRSSVNAIRRVKGEAEDIDRDHGARIGGAVCGCAPWNTVSEDEGGGNDVDPLQYDPTNLGNALLLQDSFGDNFRWVPDCGSGEWFTWNGERWQRNSAAVMSQMVHIVIDRMKGAAKAKFDNLKNAEIPDKDTDPVGFRVFDAELKTAGKASEWALRSSDTTNRNKSLDWTKDLKGVKATVNEFDRRRDLLGLAGGYVLEMKFGSPAIVRKATRADMITKATAVKYVPWAELEGEGKTHWLGLLKFFVPLLGVRECLQMAFGATLYGLNREKQYYALWGEANTGKSTILNMQMAAFGPEYSGPNGKGTFVEHDLTPWLSQAFPWRMVGVSELDENTKLQASRLKRLTGGDPITSENKNSNEQIVDIPAFNIWMATNNPPDIQGFDAATKRRMMVFPMHEASETPVSEDMTQLCAEAVLSWTVEGWNKYSLSIAEDGRSAINADRTRWPKEVVQATDEMFQMMSPISEWAENFLSPIAGGREIASKMYEKFQSWAEQKAKIPKEKVPSRSEFTQILNAHGYKSMPLKLNQAEMDQMGIAKDGVRPTHRCITGAKYIGPVFKVVGRE